MKTLIKVALFLLVLSLLPLSVQPVQATGNVIITKTAVTSYDRQYFWDVTKTGDADSLLLAPGEAHTVNYQAVASVDHVVESNFQVAGTISIQNAGNVSYRITRVVDSLGVPVTCNVGLPFTLSPGFAISCTYSATLPAKADGTNTATVYAWNPIEGVEVVLGGASVGYAFGAPASEIDECVNVNDSMVGNLGVVCASESPRTFTYSHEFVGGAECTVTPVVNTVTETGQDTGNLHDQASWTVVVTTPCDQGCSLTIGYWKTHSIYGPAQYDDTWAGYQDAPFYGNGVTWYQMIQMNPVGGNPYIQLARQYIGAKLNQANGADVSAIASTLASAETWLSGYTYTATFTKAQKSAMVALASTLDQYNNGLIGPGHCSE